jgi:hypothetical protein
MKGSKENPAVKARRTVTPARSTRSRKKPGSLNGPTEDQIRIKAQEIYNDRISSGVWGTPEDDWHKAEELLRG